MIAQNYYKLRQMTYLRQNLHGKNFRKKNMHFHDHRISPLPVQNPYAKFFLAITTLFVHRFSFFFLQVLLGQTKINRLT